MLENRLQKCSGNLPSGVTACWVGCGGLGGAAMFCCTCTEIKLLHANGFSLVCCYANDLSFVHSHDSASGWGGVGGSNTVLLHFHTESVLHFCCTNDFRLYLQTRMTLC